MGVARCRGWMRAALSLPVRIGLMLSACAIAGQQLARAQEPAALGPFPPELVWPISGTAEPDFPLSSTFGPRQMASENYRHDFHRGIDIPCDNGTPIHAIAAGKVRIAGDHASYQDRLVQIQHYKPGSGDSCSGGGCYYSNYMHLDDVRVQEGDEVEAGQVIGHSGRSKSNFAHLHFEIRDGGLYQMNCVHPLAALPYSNQQAPRIVITNVDTSIREQTKISVTVLSDGNELDVIRIDVELLQAGKLVDSRSFDMHDWNRRFTPKENPTENLDQESFNGLRMLPDQYRATSSEYRLDLVFEDLKGLNSNRLMMVKARATDVHGKSSEAVQR